MPAQSKIPHICAHALNNKAAGFRVAVVFAVLTLTLTLTLTLILTLTSVKDQP